MFDDLSTRTIGYMGDTDASTPNIDKLFSKSVVFSNMHTVKSECAPSRIAFFTGRLPSETRVYGFDNVFRKYNPNLQTFPSRLRQAGYTSMSIGKTVDERSYIVSGSNPYVYPDRCSPTNFANSCMWDFYSRMAASMDPVVCSGAVGHFPGLPASAWPRTGMSDLAGGPLLLPGGRDVDFIDYCFASTAIKKLNEAALANSKTGKPFLLVVGFAKPHLPWVAPSRWFDRYAYMLTDLNAQQRLLRRDPVNDAKNRAFFSSSTAGANTNPEDSELISYTDYYSHSTMERWQAIYATVGFLDEQVGRLMEAFYNSSVASNTVVILTSDHGFHYGDWADRPWAKKTNFDHATNIPFSVMPPPWWLAANPAVRVNVITDAVASNVDVLPTIMDFAGIPVSSFGALPGASLKPILLDPESGWVRRAAVSLYESYTQDKTVMGVSLRSKRWRFTAWCPYSLTDSVNFKKQLPITKMLWDYNSDFYTHELTNRIGSTAPGAVQARKSLSSLFLTPGGTGFQYLLTGAPFDNDLAQVQPPQPTMFPTIGNFPPGNCSTVTSQKTCLLYLQCGWDADTSQCVVLGGPRATAAPNAPMVPDAGCASVRSSAPCNNWNLCFWNPRTNICVTIPTAAPTRRPTYTAFPTRSPGSMRSPSAHPITQAQIWQAIRFGR